MKLVVVGARAEGGAHMILDLVADGAPYDVVAFLDDNPGLWGSMVGGVPVLGSPEDAARAVNIGAVGAVVFVGDPKKRERLARLLTAAGLSLPTIVHPRAYVAPSATLGQGTFVGAMATVSTGARIGSVAMIAPTALVSHHVQVGDEAQVSPMCCIGGRSVIGRRAFLGLNVIVVSGHTVGNDAVVGAGGVVTADVPPGVTVAGIPARPTQSSR